MSGGPVNNLGATSAATPSSHRLDERTFNDYHFSCFVAMETPLTIVPRFSLPRVECLGGVYGPFEPNYPVDVPMWLALHLRQTDTCTITPPPYLRIPFLTNVLAREQASDGSFEALPFYFFEIAKRLCEAGGGVASSSGTGGGATGKRSGGSNAGGRAADDIPHVAEVVRLVQEIQSVRQRKLKQSMGVFEPEGSAMFIPGIRLTHIISNELHFLRTSFATVLQQAHEMEARRAQPTAHLMGSATPSTAAAAARLPHVSLASSTPARLSTATASSTVGLGGASVSLTQDGTSVMASQPQPSLASTGTGMPDGAPTLPPSTPEDAAAAAAVAAPLVQPPAKKRRTLRQT